MVKEIDIIKNDKIEHDKGNIKKNKLIQNISNFNKDKDIIDNNNKINDNLKSDIKFSKKIIEINKKILNKSTSNNINYYCINQPKLFNILYRNDVLNTEYLNKNNNFKNKTKNKTNIINKPDKVYIPYNILLENNNIQNNNIQNNNSYNNDNIYRKLNEEKKNKDYIYEYKLPLKSESDDNIYYNLKQEKSIINRKNINNHINSVNKYIKIKIN